MVLLRWVDLVLVGKMSDGVKIGAVSQLESFPVILVLVPRPLLAAVSYLIQLISLVIHFTNLHPAASGNISKQCSGVEWADISLDIT